MQADHVLAFGAHPVGADDNAQKLAFYTELMRRVSLAAWRSLRYGGSQLRPGSGWTDNNPLTVDGHLYPWDNGKNMLRSNTVGPQVF